ncbi:MAG: biotin/lipoyl-binding carrier protein [Rubrivivax sp.]|jgi:acetyl-CoA carboxylase biotin carboxyl carrier protein|nr:biotin/lipoyl-binding carrier protein [Rubrivivax sp.]
MPTTQLLSEVTGSVWEISAQPGQQLAPGDTVMVLESMKMEIPVLCEDGGTVVEILVAQGEAVAEGQPLVMVAS